MAHSVKVGDRVTFHFIPAHRCHDREVGALHRDKDGQCRCAHTATETRAGVVTRLYDSCQQPDCAGAACEECSELARLEPIDLVVDMTEADLAVGYVREQGPQNRSRAERGTPHESGTWTPTN